MSCIMEARLELEIKVMPAELHGNPCLFPVPYHDTLTQHIQLNVEK
jgi:hypothetical protein